MADNRSSKNRDSDKEVSKSLKQLTKSVNKLDERLEHLEDRFKGSDEDGTNAGDDTQGGRQFCGLPKMPERELPPDVFGHRLDLIRVLDKKWVNGTELHYYFFTDGPFRGSTAEIDVVRNAFRAWKEVGIGLEFHEVDEISEAEIRIGFQRGAGSWSYVGRDVLGIGQNERTMNFGWRLSGSRGRADDLDTALHEIGHTLGFPHEHQNPNAGIEWNEEAVYRSLAAPPNEWSRDKTFYNIIRKIPAGDVEGSDWDPDSIMHYPFDAGLIERPARYQQGLTPAAGLSDHDKVEVKKFYPPGVNEQLEELVPYSSERLSLEAGEQANYRVVVNATREYTIATFGASDTVMVLFEKVGNSFRYVKGDDDSGSSLNAKITTRLRPDREYVLRIRLYSQYSDGETAVLMW